MIPPGIGPSVVTASFRALVSHLFNVTTARSPAHHQARRMQAPAGCRAQGTPFQQHTHTTPHQGQHLCTSALQCALPAPVQVPRASPAPEQQEKQNLNLD